MHQIGESICRIFQLSATSSMLPQARVITDI
jgi:hypothetical protein